LSNREAGQHRELKVSFISLGAPNFQKAQETAYKKKSYLEAIIQVALNSIKQVPLINLPEKNSKVVTKAGLECNVCAHQISGFRFTREPIQFLLKWNLLTPTGGVLKFE